MFHAVMLEYTGISVKIFGFIVNLFIRVIKYRDNEIWQEIQTEILQGL